jgi:hypothetical protein
MAGVFAGPQTKSVVVFGGQNDGAESGLFGGLGPLIGIQQSRIENSRVFLAFSPFAIGKSVHAEMDEHDEFRLLPFELSRCGNWQQRQRWFNGGKEGRNEKQ